MLAKKLINQILLASHKSETILARLGALRGEEMVITHDGNTYTIKLPQLGKAGDLTNVFQIVSQALGCCHNIFGKLCKKNIFSGVSQYLPSYFLFEVVIFLLVFIHLFYLILLFLFLKRGWITESYNTTFLHSYSQRN